MYLSPASAFYTYLYYRVRQSRIVETIRVYGLVRPACKSTQLQLEHDFNTVAGTVDPLCVTRLAPLDTTSQLGVPPQVALSSLLGDFRVQAIVCFSVLACLSCWTAFIFANACTPVSYTHLTLPTICSV